MQLSRRFVRFNGAPNACTTSTSTCHHAAAPYSRNTRQSRLEQSCCGTLCTQRPYRPTSSVLFHCRPHSSCKQYPALRACRKCTLEHTEGSNSLWLLCGRVCERCTFREQPHSRWLGPLSLFVTCRVECLPRVRRRRKVVAATPTITLLFAPRFALGCCRSLARPR